MQKCPRSPYYIGSKPTLGHYAGIEPLDGDVSKIEVADKTPDAGFDVNSASTYPTYQGRPVLTEHVPTKLEWQETGPVPDVGIVRGMLVVPPRFREIVEQFEVCLGRTTQRGQVVAHDDGVDTAQDALLGAQVAEGDLATAREPQDGARER